MATNNDREGWAYTSNAYFTSAGSTYSADMLIRCKTNDDHRAAGAARRLEREAQVNSQTERARRAPQAPELGATSTEGRLLCDRQGGEYAHRHNADFDFVSCRVGGFPIFTATTRDERIVHLDVYFEGADLVQERDRLTKILGEPPEREWVSDRFRVFSWHGGRLLLTMYDRGVQLSYVVK